jgi:hypothetical protein
MGLAHLVCGPSGSGDSDVAAVLQQGWSWRLEGNNERVGEPYGPLCQ